MPKVSARIDRDGLAKAYPQYAAQVAVYQHFLGVAENPAIFTVVNADTCDRVHLLVPYDGGTARAAICAPRRSSPRHVPASCCRGSPPIPTTGAAGCAVTRIDVGSRHERGQGRQADQDAVVVK